jgi:periplasmic divalent cation tolerance protein
MTDECVLVLSTFPSDADFGTVARTLVGERLAACVNVLPEMTSIYRWEGAIEEAAERQVLIKTTRANLPALWNRLRDLHPYDVPEFVVLPIIDGSDAYLEWVRRSVGRSVGSP